MYINMYMHTCIFVHVFLFNLLSFVLKIYMYIISRFYRVLARPLLAMSIQIQVLKYVGNKKNHIIDNNKYVYILFIFLIFS